MHKIGIDVGGTKIKAGLFNKKRLVKHIFLNTHASKRTKSVIGKIIKCIGILSKTTLKNRIVGVGLGLPGRLDRKKGLVIFLPNLPGWKNVPIKKILEKECGFNVKIENDANCAAIAQAKLLKKKSLVYIGIGTGLGCGVIIGGKPYHGANREFGHFVVNPDGPKCTCGRRGCLEEYVSVRGLERIAKKYFRKKISPLELYKKAQNRDKKAISSFEEMGKYLGIGLAYVSESFKPELIIIGGGISNASIFFLNSAVEEMRKRTLNHPKIEASKIKYSGMIGASLLVD